MGCSGAEHLIRSPQFNPKKEVKSMRYEKPNISPALDALTTIQSSQAKMAGLIDNLGQPHFMTAPAYEADE